MRILVAGGAGYIGSHFVRAALERDLQVAVLDDLTAGHQDVLPNGVHFVRGDIGNRRLVRDLLARWKPDAVVDFAGLIQVGESVHHPDRYFRVNVVHTLAFLDELVRFQLRSFVFSSSAAVYGEPKQAPIDEEHPCCPVSPYGSTKLCVERAALEYGHAFGLRVACLRYFNAAGAHPSGDLRERHDPETHLVPLAIDAALGRRARLTLFGADWPTPDGTCVRDYVHVVDLAEAHLEALRALDEHDRGLVLNLGSGVGCSVREVIGAVERCVGRPVPFDVGPPREGDPPVLVASVERAARILGWRARCSSIGQIVEDAVRAHR